VDWRNIIGRNIIDTVLKDLKSIENIEGVIFIYSLWEGYLPDDSLKKMIRFIKKKNMKFFRFILLYKR